MKTFAVIVTYNGMKWIKDCLNSVLDSSIPVSIIVIDNCSTDGTVEFIKSNFHQALLIDQKENLGFGRANNIGLSIALKESADYVFLLNQDAFLEKNTIEELIKVAQKNTEYGILSPIHKNGNGTELDQSFCHYVGKPSGLNFVSDFVLDNAKKDVYSVPMINAAAWLIPRITLETVGGFDPSFFLYGEDDNYCQRVLYHNFKIGIVPIVFIKHDSQNNYTKPMVKGSEKYYAKYINNFKVCYGDVSTDNYRDIGRIKYLLLKQIIINLLKFNLVDFKINLNKLKLIAREDLENKVLYNRRKGTTYLK